MGCGPDRVGGRRAELAQEAVARGVVSRVSPSTVRRWLAEDAIRPWQYRSWIFPRVPEFAAKAGRVLDLYDRRWNGRRLRQGPPLPFSG